MSSAGGGPGAPKPNIIVVLTDDQGYADVGFNGSREILTPHIDRIASEGIRFEQGYVSFPTCGPSRAGLLTGRYQDRFGFTRNPTIDPRNAKAGIPLQEENIAEVLKKAGYTTGAIGKWHVGTHPSLRPGQRGFDEFFGFLSGGHKYFPRDLTLNDLSQVTEKWEWYRTRLLRNEQRVTVSEYLTDEFSNEAVAFIQRHRDKPFFLYLAYNAPHTPFEATKKYLDRYAHIADTNRRTYAAMISAVDDGVGKVLDTLQMLGIERNTVVFFLSDNGGRLVSTGGASDNRPLRGGKGELYEGGNRVPFALRWTGTLPAGQTYREPVSSLDIMATAVTLAGAPVAPERPLDGVNLIPYITQKRTGSPHDILFWRMYGARWAVRQKNEKLFVDLKLNQTELYDLDRDLSEKTNLHRGPNDSRAASLSAQYQEWEKQMVGPAFPGLSDWPWP